MSETAQLNKRPDTPADLRSLLIPFSLTGAQVSQQVLWENPARWISISFRRPGYFDTRSSWEALRISACPGTAALTAVPGLTLWLGRDDPRLSIRLTFARLRRTPPANAVVSMFALN